MPSIPAVRPLIWLVACSLFTGCATTEITTVQLTGVVRGERDVMKGAVPEAQVRYARGTAPTYNVPIAVGQALATGDSLWTGPDAAAVVSYPGGARAYVRPGSHVRIGSIFADFGKVFVKVKGVFKVSTTHVTAGSEGTEYWVDAPTSGPVHIVVVEGVVRLSSNGGKWADLRLRAGEQAWIRGTAVPQVSPADPAEMRRESDWTGTMDKLVPVATHVSPLGVGLGVGAAIGLGILLNSGKDKPSDPPRPPTSNPTSTGAAPGTGSTSSTGIAGTRTPSSTTTRPAPAPAPAPAPIQIK